MQNQRPVQKYSLILNVSERPKMATYQDIIMSSIGEFGRAQLIIVLGCSLPKFFAAWSMLIMSFAGADPDWWSVTTHFNKTSNNSYSVRQYKICPKHDNETIVFDESIYTIVSEWGLVCSRDWIPTAITTTQMVGVLVGAAVVGQLGDLIGRKISLLLVYIIQIVFTMILGFSHNWYMMIVCIFVVGFSLGGYLVVNSVFMLEFIGTRYRTVFGLLPLWAFGVMIFGVMFKLLPNWRHLCFATAGLGSPFIIFICFIPESIRWLFIKGRYEEGKTILRNMAKINKLVEPDLSVLDEVLAADAKFNKSKKIYGCLTLFKMEGLRKKTIIFAFVWFTCAFTYYALTLGVSRLSGDITVNMILMGLGECFCMVIVWALSKCFGRKYTTMILFLLTSFSSFGITISYFAAPESRFKLAMNVLALISRWSLSAAWASVIVFTAESFPTVIRNVAYGFVSVCARVGGIVAPQNKTLSQMSIHLPFTINGGLTLTSGLLCLLLTDTYTTQMEDHFEEDVQRVRDCIINDDTKETDSFTS